MIRDLFIHDEFVETSPLARLMRIKMFCTLLSVKIGS